LGRASLRGCGLVLVLVLLLCIALSDHESWHLGKDSSTVDDTCDGWLCNRRSVDRCSIERWLLHCNTCSLLATARNKENLRDATVLINALSWRDEVVGRLVFLFLLCTLNL